MNAEPISAREALPNLLRASLHADVVISSGVDDGAGAAFSRCETYRYLLWRVWNPDLPFWSFGMLNPSTADHMKLDPTVTRCCSRAQRGGAGGLIVWNLFAYRATDPDDMKRAAQPVGSANERAIRHAVAASAINIAAWGADGAYRGGADNVLAMLAKDGVPLHALAFTAAGQPRHPLYLSAHLEPQPWEYGA
jgi:hypothetical protein